MTVYGDYLRNKVHSAIKFGYSEGSPCIAKKNSKTGKLKNYKIYGNSIQNKNILPYPYATTSQEINGVTLTYNADGTIVANGTATANVRAVLVNANTIEDFKTDSVYNLSGCPAGGSTSTYFILWDTIGYDTGSGVVYNKTGKAQGAIILGIDSGFVCEGLTFKPMLVKGYLKPDYESQVCSFEHQIPVKSIGEKTSNLLIYPFEVQNTSTVNGITIKEDHGVVKLNGTASASTSIPLIDGKLFTLNPGRYWLSGCPVGGSTSTYHLYCNVMKYSSDYSSSTLVTSFGDVGSGIELNLLDLDYNGIVIGISIKNGGITDELDFYPMLQDYSSGDVVSYEPVGYKLPMNISGKNVFDVTQISYFYRDSETYGKCIYLSANASRSNSVGKISTMLKGLKAGRTYILTAETTSSSGRFFYLSGSKTVWKWGQSHTMTQADLDGILAVYKCTNETDPEVVDKLEVYIYNIQVEEGTVATDYEPYLEPIVSSLYLQEPLRKLPDGQVDVIDFQHQKVIRQIGEIILDGKENWIDTDMPDVVEVNFQPFVFGVGNTPLISAGYFNVDEYAVASYTGFTSQSSVNSYLMYKETGITAESLKGRLENQNAWVTGVLENSIEESVSLPELPMYKGYTTIYEIDSDPLMSNMKLKYIRK